ncbi:MAG TPA: hypothetical protein VGF78_04975 [Candidatus Dormibacteraeota bacterium]|jgi:hypothetical protein
MKRLTLSLILLVLLNACTRGPVTHPAPSVAQIGSDLNCATGDHGFEDADAGWGFCYPATWKYDEKTNLTSNPSHLDILLYFTDVPCVPGTPIAGASPRPVCSPGAGKFGLVFVSTYDRGSATDLASWVAANQSPVPTLQSIQWANATEAGKTNDGRRIALTPHRVVIVDLRAATDGLDLETQMSARLSTWKFLY